MVYPGLFQRSCFALLLAGLAASPAIGATSAVSTDIPAAPLADALQDLVRQSGIELLYDRTLTVGVRSAAVRGRLTPEAALGELLHGTSLTMRRAESGALIIERPGAPPLARQDAPVPEILIVGHRSQDADIRRVETDIQPYRVVRATEIREADRDNLDQYFRSRVPTDASAVPPGLETNGETNSEIDLRGLGPDATLVLIDGRRMPSIPAALTGFRQPDINAVPLYAIDRVEILTGAAGGIFGFGALGGVVNVVLAQGRDGAEIHAAGGLTSRGDAASGTLEGRITASPDGGQTEISIYAAASRSDPLTTGQRPFLSDDLKLSAALAPSLFAANPTHANSVMVTNANGLGPLTLKPQYGGATLSSNFTFLPAGGSGLPADVAAALAQHAGTYDTSLSPGAAASEIGSNPKTEALLANIRHQFGGGFEIYVDAVVLRDEGEFVGHDSFNIDFLNRRSPLDPFVQSVQLAFPVEGSTLDRRSTFNSDRFTAGLVAPLPFNWRASIDAALGSAQYRFAQTLSDFGGFPFGNAPSPNPFGSWTDFQAALAALRTTSTENENITNRFHDYTLRLAGPVLRTPGGLATVSLLAERRTEDVPAYTDASTDQFGLSSTVVEPRNNETTSFYAELRSPIFGDAGPLLLKHLEVQAAVRHDTQTDDFSPSPSSPPANNRAHVRFSGTFFTAGAKVSPAPWLMLRGSYATGRTPPPLTDLAELQAPSFAVPANDPKRGNQDAGSEPSFTYLIGGNPKLSTSLATTASFGGILTPFGDAGPRLTLDYSRIRESHTVFQPTAQMILNSEDSWPSLVMRGPLTPADQALGYTGGPITLLDARAQSSGSLRIDTIDARIESSFRAFGGRLHVYGDGTYFIHNSSTAPFQASVDHVDVLNGALRERVNAGADWSVGSFTFGTNVQYFGGYRLLPLGEAPFVIPEIVALQGSDRIPAQVYVDLHVSWSHSLPAGSLARNVKVDFGVVNLLNRQPPRESASAISEYTVVTLDGPAGYSRYGDPRMRRFRLTLSGAF